MFGKAAARRLLTKMLHRTVTSRPRRPERTHAKFRPQVENLGDRIVPSTVTEYSTPTGSSGPVDIMPDPTGGLGFVEFYVGKFGRTDTSGSITEVSLTGVTSTPADLSFTDDGVAWITGWDSPVVARVDTDNSITSISIPNSSDQPNGSCIGPDGFVWFTTFGGGRVGKINPANNAVTEYDIGTGTLTCDIIAGPDGRIWFTEFGVGKVASIATDGSDLQEYDLGSGSIPFGLAVGTDGNIYVAENGSSQISVVTPEGDVTPHNLASGSAPWAVTRGPDGAIWFAESGTGKVGRIDTAGNISEISIPTSGSTPTGITSLPGDETEPGSVWVTEWNGAKIAKITADPTISVTATDTSEGSATGGFTFTRSGDITDELTVTYTVGGTATPETDYTALSGSVTFLAGEDRVEVPVEAFGDNTVDDGETVTATIDTDSSYIIDGATSSATVNIADQPLTVSVAWLADGEEGSSNGAFRFTRAGDISSSLTVSYTVSGTATSGSDFTALSGTVTFPANSDQEDVTIYVTDDGTAEPTETVIVTLDEIENYELGNDSDTMFIKDNDTTRVIWTNADQDGLWENPDNWSTNSVPTSSDDVYFIASNEEYPHASDDCADLGWTELGEPLTLQGIHIVDAYPGNVVLGTGLNVGTYEQTSGTLDQPEVGFNLSVDKAFLWSGGTLNATDSGAVANIDGASGRIDPPNTGSMATSSTLRVISNALVTVLPGALEFAGGSGLYVAADVRVVSEDSNVSWQWTNTNINTTAPQLEVGTNGQVLVTTVDKTKIGIFTCEFPILNKGSLVIGGGIHTTVKGHIGGENGPSIKQESGSTTIYTGGTTVTNGLVITGGDLWVAVREKLSEASLKGNLTFTGTGSFGSIGFLGGGLKITGNMNWSNGTYKPRIDGENINAWDSWSASGTIEVGAQVGVTPGITNAEAAKMNKWLILIADKIKGVPPALPAGFGDWEIAAADIGNAIWRLRAK